MAASTGDKITDTRNAARPSSTTVASPRSSGGGTLSCNSLTGWPTASKVHFVTYQIDSNSNPIAGTQLDCRGIVSGNSITSFAVLDGTDNGNSVGDVVEMMPTASWGQDLSDALLVGHTRAGAHASSLPLTSPILTTPTIADFTNATHTHANAAGGGQLTGSNALVNSTVTADKLSTGAQTATVATSQTTTSLSFTDLATTGPSVTVTIGANGLALVSLYTGMSNNTNNQSSFAGYVVSGANTIAATSSDTVAMGLSGAANYVFRSGYTILLTGLSPGSTTFKMQYLVDGGTGTFYSRKITVVPL